MYIHMYKYSARAFEKALSLNPHHVPSLTAYIAMQEARGIHSSVRVPPPPPSSLLFSFQTHLWVPVYFSMHACMHAYVYTDARTRTHTSTHSHTQVHKFTHAHMQTHRLIKLAHKLNSVRAFTHVIMHSCTDTYMHVCTHTHIHTHKHTQTLERQKRKALAIVKLASRRFEIRLYAHMRRQISFEPYLRGIRIFTFTKNNDRQSKYVKVCAMNIVFFLGMIFYSVSGQLWVKLD